MDDSLPDPALSLTLPSIHDGTPLDCRIYLPPSILAVAAGHKTPAASRWRGHAAVVAHPYAPLGGSYNDPIVKMVAHTLLQPRAAAAEYVVATFNFRGAGRKPQGRTSWTAKPETGDYMTVAGFLYYFAHYLDPYGEKEAALAAPATPAPSSPASAPTLLFAGYSYGAMVTSLLPPLATLLAVFARPLRGAPAADVRLRAARWAAIQNADFAACRERAASSAASPTRGSAPRTRLSMGVRAGGVLDDDAHGHGHALWPRRSHDVALHGGGGGGGGGGGAMRHILSPSSPRRSLSGDHRHSTSGNGHVRSRSSNDASGTGTAHDSKEAAGGSQRGVSAWMLAHVRPGGRHDIGSTAAAEDKGTGGSSTRANLPVLTNLPAARPAYLLVSPPVGLATNLTTMSFGAGAAGSHGGGLFRRKKTAPAPVASREEEAAAAGDPAGRADDGRDKLATSPTLVVYGDADGFVSAKKMHQWTQGLAAASASPARPRPLFRALAIPTAGHFWAEGRTLYELEEAVAAFAAQVTERPEEAPGLGPEGGGGPDPGPREGRAA